MAGLSSMLTKLKNKQITVVKYNDLAYGDHKSNTKGQNCITGMRQNKVSP